jgi:hypothetical protein
MSLHQPRFKSKKIPFGRSRFQHMVGINLHAVKNQSQFVDIGDIKVTLCILNGFGRLGHLYGGCFLRSCFDVGTVQFINLLSCLGALTGVRTVIIEVAIGYGFLII